MHNLTRAAQSNANTESIKKISHIQQKFHCHRWAVLCRSAFNKQSTSFAWTPTKKVFITEKLVLPRLHCTRSRTLKGTFRKPQTYVAPYSLPQLFIRQIYLYGPSEPIAHQSESRDKLSSERFCPAKSGQVFRSSPLVCLKRLSRSLTDSRKHKRRWGGLTKSRLKGARRCC